MGMAENAKRSYTIRPMVAEDYPQVEAIYEHGLDSGHASWEHSAPSWEEFEQLKRMDLCFVAEETGSEDAGKILGWVSGSSISKRAIFHGVVEDSIYIHPDGQGMGLARALLQKLLDVAAEQGIWALHSWVFPENVGSLMLHRKLGFREVGTYHHLAKMTYGPMAGQWRDIIILEKMLEKPEEAALRKAAEEAEAAGDPLPANRPDEVGEQLGH